jgi:hypothetical protein
MKQNGPLKTYYCINCTYFTTAMNKNILFLCKKANLEIGIEMKTPNNCPYLIKEQRKKKLKKINN